MGSSERLILMGVIGKPHGVRGWVRVNAFTEDPAALAAYRPLLDARGRKFTLAWVGGGIAQLCEITPAGERKIGDRTQAERLTNTELFVPRSALPEAEEEEFYLADLVGLAVCDQAGSRIGTVSAVHDYGAGPSLEISISSGGASLLVPFTQASVPVVDVPAGYAIVVPPAEIEVR